MANKDSGSYNTEVISLVNNNSKLTNNAEYTTETKDTKAKDTKAKDKDKDTKVRDFDKEKKELEKEKEKEIEKIREEKEKELEKTKKKIISEYNVKLETEKKKFRGLEAENNELKKRHDIHSETTDQMNKILYAILIIVSFWLLIHL